MRVWEEETSTSVFIMAITRTFIASRDPYGLFLSLFSINLNSLKSQWNVKCYEYLYPFVAFSCYLIWRECCVWLCALLSPCYHPLCVKMWPCASEVCVGGWGWGTLKECWSLKASSEVDVVNVWQVPIESLCLKWLRMHFLCFVNKGKSEIKLNLTRYNALLIVTYF